MCSHFLLLEHEREKVRTRAAASGSFLADRLVHANLLAENLIRDTQLRTTQLTRRLTPTQGRQCCLLDSTDKNTLIAYVTTSSSGERGGHCFDRNGREQPHCCSQIPQRITSVTTSSPKGIAFFLTVRLQFRDVNAWTQGLALWPSYDFGSSLPTQERLTPQHEQ